MKNLKICLVGLLVALIAFGPAQARPKTLVGIAAETATIQVGKVLIKKGAKKGVERLTGKAATIARACVARQYGAIKGQVTDQLISHLVEKYFAELVDMGAPKFLGGQLENAVGDFTKRGYVNLDAQNNSVGRNAYKRGRTDLIQRWSDAAGENWPRRPDFVKDGRLKMGQLADVHHIRPLANGGHPTALKNATPLFLEGHQQGIHKRDSMLNVLLKCMKARQ